MLFSDVEHQLLFDSLGGLVAGGLSASWIAGMALVEGIRAAQDLYQYPSFAFRTYIVLLLTLSLAPAGLFGAVLHHHMIVDFGDYDSVDRIYPLLRVISRMRGLYLPLILMVVIGFLVLGSGLASGIAAYDFFQQTSYYVIHSRLSMWQAMFFTELACDLGLTSIRAVYMYKANDIKAVVTHAGHPIRYVADVFLLAARTPIYNAIFALIALCALGSGSFGTRYVLVYGGSQLALVAMFTSAAYTFSYLTDKPHHALGTSAREPKGFPEELFAFNNRMHDSRLDAQRIVRARQTPLKPIDDLFVEDEDEFASDGIKIEPARVLPELDQVLLDLPRKTSSSHRHSHPIEHPKSV